tara:strand:- start:444 stop:767 length:324 start_codon:yes stop_codon:yes gene_type:complete
VEEKDIERKLPIVSKRQIRFYGILAILIIIIPEYIASIVLNIYSKINDKDNYFFIDFNVDESYNKLLLMSIYELRKESKKLNIIGYSSDNKDVLISNLIRIKRNKDN